MRIKCFPTAEMGENCYVISSTQTNDAIILDPGEENPEVTEYIKNENITPKAIALTHGHYDHIAGVNYYKEQYKIPLICGCNETETLASPSLNLSPLFCGNALILKADKTMTEGEEYTFGDLTFKTIFTPGHTPGGMCLYFEKEGALFSGDSLFALSIGRTDFPGGSYRALTDSLKEKILTLPEETVVFPGHGPKTTVKTEKAQNPYL